MTGIQGQQHHAQHSRGIVVHHVIDAVFRQDGNAVPWTQPQMFQSPGQGLGSIQGLIERNAPGQIIERGPRTEPFRGLAEHLMQVGHFHFLYGGSGAGPTRFRVRAAPCYFINPASL